MRWVSVSGPRIEVKPPFEALQSFTEDTCIQVAFSPQKQLTATVPHLCPSAVPKKG